jgi:hypothetical protein
MMKYYVDRRRMELADQDIGADTLAEGVPE